MSSNSENSNISDESDFEVPSDIDTINYDTPSPSPQPQSPEPYLSFVQKVYPLSFFYNYDSIKLKEYSNKIILPMYVLDSISKDTRVEYPLFFYIIKDDIRYYFSVGEFLPDVSDFYIPNHIFTQLGIDYGEYQEIMIDFKTLEKGTHMVIEPHDKEFLNIPNHKLYLETHLVRSYPCLSQGSTIRILHGKGFLDFNIKETKPSYYITTLDTDIEVDFKKPLNYVEPPPKVPPKKEEKPKPEQQGFVPFSGKGNKLGSS